MCVIVLVDCGVLVVLLERNVISTCLDVSRVCCVFFLALPFVVVYKTNGFAPPPRSTTRSLLLFWSFWLMLSVFLQGAVCLLFFTFYGVGIIVAARPPRLLFQFERTGRASSWKLRLHLLVCRIKRAG